jgi:hypothetical protein
MKSINDILWNLGKPLFFVLIGLSLWGTAVFETPMNAPFVWTWRHLALPVLGIGWLYGVLQRDYFLKARQIKKGSFWFSLVVCPPLVLLFLGGVSSLVNGLFSTNDTVTYEGPITKLYISGGRHKECEVVLTDHSAGEITLGVSRTEYATLVLGQTYRRQMRIGLLGIPFRPMSERS